MLRFEIDEDFADINPQLHNLYQDFVLAEQAFIDRSLGRLFRGLIGLALGVGSLAGLIVWTVTTGVARTIDRAASSVSASAAELQATVTAARAGNEIVAKNMTAAQTAQTVSQVLTELTASIGDMATSNQQISLNIQQQANAIKPVNQAMAQLNQGAQATAQGIAQTRQETQALQNASQRLKAII